MAMLKSKSEHNPTEAIMKKEGWTVSGERALVEQPSVRCPVLVRVRVRVRVMDRMSQARPDMALTWYPGHNPNSDAI